MGSWTSSTGRGGSRGRRSWPGSSLSASTGLNKGIQLLSNTNVILAGLLMAAVFVLGPTVFLLDTFTTSV
ncbi:hypothetical protein CTI14_50555, partial [Methylobacterium radiotolerans]